jgi:hypothetical protein
LAFYEDLGIRFFYRDRHPEGSFQQEKPVESVEDRMRPTQIAYREPTLPKIPRKPELPKVVSTAPSKTPPLALPAAAGPSLFDAADKIAGDTLLRVREDLGECTRCKLHKHRRTIVFGDGNPKAEIVCLGAVAAKTLLRTNRGISQFRGQWLDYRGSKLMATYHPAYLLRNPNAKGEVWKDLQKVMAVLGLQARKGRPA